MDTYAILPGENPRVLVVSDFCYMAQRYLTLTIVPREGQSLSVCLSQESVETLGQLIVEWAATHRIAWDNTATRAYLRGEERARQERALSVLNLMGD